MNCPRCNADEYARQRWKCMSSQYEGTFHQSSQCRIRELETSIKVAHAQLTGWAIANACSDEKLAAIVEYLAGLVKE